MFEQSLYNQEAFAPPAEAHEGDLFHKYEIKNWELSPRLYKILAVSALVNLVIVVIAGQTAVLTAKGCDSPFVGRVCEVLDTVYVGSILFGTPREYVDQEYEKTELANADVTFVNVGDAEPQLEYPEGYFALANPEQAAMLAAQANNSTNGGYTSPLPDPMSNDLLNKAPELPKANPNAVLGEIPTSPLGDPDTSQLTPLDRDRRNRRKTAGVPANNAANTSASIGNQMANTNSNTANSTMPPVDEAKPDQFGVYINKRPLKDRAKETLAKVESNTIKLDNSFKVVIAGTLGPGADGKTIILKNPKPVPFRQTAPSDPELVKLVQDWILAVGDAGWFGYLDKLKAKNIVITVEQNDTELVASVRADQPTENDAKSAASGFNALLGLAVPAAKGDEQEFLKKASTTADGKSFILNFSIPKPEVQEMIQRKLADSKDPEPVAQPSSTASTKSGGDNQSR